jgi:hypothetical protein
MKRDTQRLCRCDLAGTDSAVVQRRGDERSVTSRIGQLPEVLETANPTAGQQRQARRSVAHFSDQPMIESGVGADARQVDHDEGADAGADCTRGYHVRRFPGCDAIGRDNRLTVAQIEAEGDSAPADGGANLGERIVGCERFESNDDVSGAKAGHVASAVGRRDARVQPDRREGTHGSDRRVLRRLTENGVQIGHVQFAEAQARHVCMRQRSRVAPFDERPRHHPDWPVMLTRSRARVHGAAGEQVDDADHAHEIPQFMLGAPADNPDGSWLDGPAGV